MLLEDVSGDRNNNLNFIRFVSAAMVVLSHAYPISISGGGIDLLGRISGGQIHFGGLAVYVFFFFSGFFLNRSMHKTRSVSGFLVARCVRIFPCLMVVIWISAFLLGACVTEETLKGYYADSQTYEYLLNMVFILRHDLPGVFIHNAYGRTVNGSLWTLPVEALCYVGCCFAWKMGLSKEKVMGYTVPVFFVGYFFLYAWFGHIRILLLKSALRPCGMFYCGMLCDTYRKRIHIKIPYVCLCGMGLALSVAWGVLEYGFILFLPYVLLYVAFGTKRKLGWFAKKHEISYGMYLCAWPIQQTVAMLFGGSMDPILNFLASMPVIMLMGYLLDIFVEKPIRGFWGQMLQKRR